MMSGIFSLRDDNYTGSMVNEGGQHFRTNELQVGAHINKHLQRDVQAIILGI